MNYYDRDKRFSYQASFYSYIGLALIVIYLLLFCGCKKIQDPIIIKEKDTIIVILPTDTISITDTVVIHDTVTIFPPQIVYAVKDLDGNGYTADTIGNQIWLGENLRTTTYNDGTSIPHVTGTGTTNTDEDWIYAWDAYCWYNQNPELGYGAIYNKYAVNTDKLCPVGWRVPGDDDWKTLFTNLGGVALMSKRDTNFYYLEIGGKLKEAGEEHWQSPNEGANDKIGFTALPAGGFFSWDGKMPYLFRELGQTAIWWTSSPPTGRYFSSTWVHLEFNSNKVYMSKHPYSETMGFSVRCIKN